MAHGLLSSHPRDIPDLQEGNSHSAPSSEYRPAVKGSLKRKRKCYMFLYHLKEPHQIYPCLCNPCGDFNVAHATLSLPKYLDLTGKVAVVAVGCISLGFHVSLRLLRCGARVIVTSRYPRDAKQRYMAETDFQDFCCRLKVIGADFRAAKDVFELLISIKTILS